MLYSQEKPWKQTKRFKSKPITRKSIQKNACLQLKCVIKNDSTLFSPFSFKQKLHLRYSFIVVELTSNFFHFVALKWRFL